MNKKPKNKEKKCAPLFPDHIRCDYLSGRLDEAGLMRFFDEKQNKNIKTDGAVYTPELVVKKMIEMVDPDKKQTIIEPSCGHGAFLLRLIHYVTNKNKLEGQEALDWFTTKVTGLDLSINSVQELRAILSLFFEKNHNIKTPPDTFQNIVHQDGLDPLFNKKFDVCIGNPPYIRTKNMESDYLLMIRENFLSCQKGNVDIYYAFIEKYLNQSKKLCFITPNSFLSNESGKPLKKMVVDAADVIIDFKSKLIFTEARTYTCIFLIGDIFKKNKTFKTASDIDQKFSFKEKKQECGAEPCDVNAVLEKNNVRVLSGIATLADSVFLVKKRPDGFFACADKKNFKIEKGLLVPYLKLTKFKPNTLNNDYMIYPYSKKNKSILSEDDLKSSYPKGYEYLCSRRKKLDGRDKGKTDKYEAWFSYGRKQGLHGSPASLYAVAVPQMIGGTCQPYSFNLSSIVNPFGAFVFTSGFVILVNKKEHSEFFDDEKFVDFLKGSGKEWPGADAPYYSLTVKQIKTYIAGRIGDEES